MSRCDNIIIWQNVPAGGCFCASVSGTNRDFRAGVRLVGADGSETQFFTADLDPGPAQRSLSDQQYAARFSATPGGQEPTVTMNAWVELEGTRTDECTWTVSGAFKSTRVTIILVP